MTWATIHLVQPTQQKAWRAGRFWWDWPQPVGTTVQPLKHLSAVIFDLDAIADVECAGHRPAFNAAFAELGLDIEWTVAALPPAAGASRRTRRVSAELRRRGVSSECDVLAELLVDEICAAKEMILDETILDADIAARTGLVELITEAFGAGIGDRRSSAPEGTRGSNRWCANWSGRASWARSSPSTMRPGANLYDVALADLGAPAQDSLAFAGSQASQRKAAAAGLATVLIDG